jgi:hypothetical protein
MAFTRQGGYRDGRLKRMPNVFQGHMLQRDEAKKRK